MREKTHRIPSVDENLFEEYREIHLFSKKKYFLVFVN